MMKFIFNLIFSLSFLSATATSCNLLLQAFASVSNFHDPAALACDQILHLRLPSSNLSGTVSWSILKNLTSLVSIDLSRNSLHGSIPGSFFSSSTLLSLDLSSNLLGGPLRFDPPGSSRLVLLNLSSNRFTSATFSSSPNLRSLDLSLNNIASVPVGLGRLRELRRLDVSHNSMSGAFPGDFPPIDGLKYLNVSFNNLTGTLNAITLDKFGGSAFTKAGSLRSNEKQRKRHDQPHHHQNHRHRKLVIVAVAVAVGIVGLLLILFGGAMWLRRRKRGANEGWKEEEKGVRAAEEVAGWVAGARWSAAVVVFEKPLMEVTFSELAAATSGFGKEAMLAEGSGRSGPAYRAALPGDMQVVVRVVEGLRGVEEREAEVVFKEMARLRHHNLLPLLGYCIAGREKLALYEYMERGDMHQWLHELPAGHPDSDDWTADTWEPSTAAGARTTARDWPARHRIALGIARGLAFLHQGWAGSRQPIVHGRLVPSNILLDGNLEPRIADFAAGGGEEETTEGNVYSYGLLVLELVTGRGKWTSEEVERVRKSVRGGNGLREVDLRMEVEGGWEGEMVECLRVGYLCTAESPEKRPTMQQVVGLLKDIRPPSE